MHQSSRHRNIFLSLSPQPTRLHLQRCTQPWVLPFLPASGWLRKVCWLRQMLLLHLWKLFLSKQLSCVSLLISLLIYWISSLCSFTVEYLVSQFFFFVFVNQNLLWKGHAVWDSSATNLYHFFFTKRKILIFSLPWKLHVHVYVQMFRQQI